MGFGRMGSRGGFGSSGVLGRAATAVSLPAVTNYNYIIVGDSRTASSSDTAALSSAVQNSSGGWLGWLNAYIGTAGVCVGNFGVNTDTIQGTATRQTAQGIATGVSPTWRAEYDTQSPAKDAAIAIFLIGVNNTSETVGTFGPRYDALFSAELDAGRQCIIICNEVPNNNVSGWGANNLSRRDYLDTWPDSSSSLTALQKATYKAKRVIVNSYDALADTPRSIYGQGGSASVSSPIYTSANLLHPNARGNRILGETIGATLSKVLAKSGYSARNALPAVGLSDLTQSVFGQVFTDFTSTSAITATNGETAGTGGANMDGNGGVGVSGVVIKNAGSNLMTITRSANLQTALNGTQDGSAQLSVVASVVSVNGRNNLRLTISSNGVALPASGTLAIIVGYVLNLSQAQVQALSLNSATLQGMGRIAFPALQTGLRSCGMLMNVSRPSYSPGQYFTLSDGSNILGDLSSPNAFDANVMTNPLALPSNFDGTAGTYSFTSQVRFQLTNSVAINTTIDIGALGIYPNR